MLRIEWENKECSEIWRGRLSAELEARLELARRHEFFCLPFVAGLLFQYTFFFNNSFYVFVLEDCVMHGGLVK